MGPNTGVRASKPVKLLVASKYNDPEKNNIPAEKKHPAKVSVLVWILSAKNTTAINAAI